MHREQLNAGSRPSRNGVGSAAVRKIPIERYRGGHSPAKGNTSVAGQILAVFMSMNSCLQVVVRQTATVAVALQPVIEVNLV